MSDKQEFVDDIRVRIPAGWKAQLLDIAHSSEDKLDMSDIVRRAIKRYLNKRTPTPTAAKEVRSK